MNAGDKMLTMRQYLMLDFYIKKRGEFVSSQELAAHFNVSVRTIKNELKAIKEDCETSISFTLETIASKGTRICVLDEGIYKKEILELKKSIQNIADSNTQSRCLAIMKLLLDTTGYIRKYTLAETFFISESTLYHALRDVKELLAKDHLRLIHKTNFGYRIEGKEVDKRMCIVKHDFMEDTSSIYQLSEDITTVYDVVADTFLKYKYQVNEQVLQNITSHIILTINRVKTGNIIEVMDEQSFSSTIEYQISNEILTKFLAMYNIRLDYFTNEVNLLAQSILGKLDYARNDELQEEINNFINDAFLLIRNKFCVNFAPIENLKVFLALHLVPLFYRIKSGTQLSNMMAFEIRQSFPLANDIAIYFSLLMEEQFHLRISQDEICYLSLYFNYGLENFHLGNSAKRILIITALRKSETVLLRHKILTWFPNQIAEINFISAENVEVNYEDYDAVFSTDKDTSKYKGGVTSIHIFPEEKDFEKINLAINGYTDLASIKEKFSEDCYFFGTVETKEEILDIVCRNAINKYHLSEDFIEVITSRERISCTYFGNGVAIPHPLTPFSNETFVSLGVLKEPIQWDSSHQIRVVMLVSIEKNNPKAFQFWYYISTLVRNEEIFQSLYEDASYDHFIQLLQHSLKDEFE